MYKTEHSKIIPCQIQGFLRKRRHNAKIVFHHFTFLITTLRLDQEFIAILRNMEETVCCCSDIAMLKAGHDALET